MLVESNGDVDVGGIIIRGGGPLRPGELRLWLGGGPIRFVIGETEEGIVAAGVGPRSGVLKRLGFGIEGVVPGGPDEASSPLREAIRVAGVDAWLIEDSTVACGVAGVIVGSEMGGSGAFRFVFEVSIVGDRDGIGAPIATGGGLRMAVGTGADGMSL